MTQFSSQQTHRWLMEQSLPSVDQFSEKLEGFFTGNLQIGDGCDDHHFFADRILEACPNPSEILVAPLGSRISLSTLEEATYDQAVSGLKMRDLEESGGSALFRIREHQSARVFLKLNLLFQRGFLFVCPKGSFWAKMSGSSGLIYGSQDKEVIKNF